MQSLALLLVAGACALADILSRRVPSWLFLTLLGALVLCWSLHAVEVSPLGALVGFAGTIGARLPGGDARAAMLAGALGGPLLTALALLVAHATAALRWHRGARGFPWVPHFASPLMLLMVIAHGG